jgi:hypothetical protein
VVSSYCIPEFYYTRTRSNVVGAEAISLILEKSPLKKAEDLSKRKDRGLNCTVPSRKLSIPSCRLMHAGLTNLPGGGSFAVPAGCGHCPSQQKASDSDCLSL